MSDLKVSYHTLGCKLNFAETSAISRLFAAQGCVRASAAEADVCLVNSCSVTEHADKKCRNLIRRLHRLNPSAAIVVTGCYAQLRPESISALEGVELVIGNADKGEVCRRTLASMARPRPACSPFGVEESARRPASPQSFFPAYSVGDRARSFLKVQDGCDYCCSYCTIHYARGASRSIPVAQVVKQAEAIARAGVKEIVITGVNIGDYGRGTEETFLGLLRALDKVEGIERYRISSVEPNLLTDDIIDFCSRSPRFMPHFHIPLQSGSDGILHRMGRRYGSDDFRGRVEAVRSRIPDAFIGVDVIVGFPGESANDFNSTVALLEELRPAYLHVFPFSERPGTPAASFPDKVPDSEKTRRANALNALCGRLQEEFYSRFTGVETGVLIESVSAAGYVSGYTENYLRVRIPGDRRSIGSVRRAVLSALHEGPVFEGLLSDGKA